MPSISRASLPQEFFDITTAQLLIQPEPQYLHAQLIMNALNAEFDAGGPLGLPMPGRQFGDTGPSYMQLPEMQSMLADPIFKDAVKVVVELGKPQVGHTIRINRPKFDDSVYTRAARRVPVGATISTTPITVGSEQAQITLDRYVGPYDSANSRVAPYAVERFDANRGVHSMAAIKELHIQRDFHRTMDGFGVALFDQVDSSTGIVRPDGMATNDSSVAVGDFPMSYNVLKKVQLSLEEAKIPRFSNGRYMMILSPLQCTQLEGDSQYQKLAKFHPDFNPLFRKSYVGTVGAFDILKSVTLTRVANTNSIPIHYGQAFGPGMVGMGAGEMPRVMPNTQDNFGETSLVVWIFYAGFEVLDSRFGRSIRTS